MDAAVITDVVRLTEQLDEEGILARLRSLDDEQDTLRQLLRVVRGRDRRRQPGPGGQRSGPPRS